MSQFKQVSSTQDLVICLDFADPHSYLALTGSLALVKDLNLSVQWLPLSAGLSRLSSRQPGRKIPKQSCGEPVGYWIFRSRIVGSRLMLQSLPSACSSSMACRPMHQGILRRCSRQYFAEA
jgi:hypothetical protein